MPKSNIQKNAIVILLLIAFSSIATENQTPIIDAMKQWKIGNKWRIEFNKYFIKGRISLSQRRVKEDTIPKIMYTYPIFVEIVDTGIYMQVKCWVIKYNSNCGLSASALNTAGYLVYISRCDGFILKIENNNDKEKDTDWSFRIVNGFQENSFVSEEYPIETIASIMSCTIIKDSSKVYKRRIVRTTGAEVSIKKDIINSIKKSYLLKFPDVPKLVLYQEWEKEAPWWIKFKKYKYGQIVYEAIRIDN